MGDKTKATILTLVFSIGSSVAIIAFNLFYNRFLIQNYGSDMNGLISTLTQFVSLFTIFEGGYATAAVVATYEPIVNNNYIKLNNILFTIKKTFNRVGVIISLTVLVLGSIYIKFINSPLGYIETLLLLVVSVCTVVSNFCILSKYSIFLQGNNKEYILTIFSFITKTITWIVSMILILMKINIFFVFAMNFINILFNSLLLYKYEKRKYKYVTYEGIYNKELISGTRDVLLQKIAGTIFTSTDLILISVCISLSVASVYNLYYQIFRAIFTLLSSAVQAPFNSFGQLANTKDKSGLYEYFQIYQHILLIVSTVLLTITGILMIPFVQVYTKSIFDINYIYPILPLLFFAQIFSQVINRPYGALLNVTGNFKLQNRQCIISVFINLVLSIAFIRWWGIYSIVLGSFCGTLVILVMNIYHAYKHVFCRFSKRIIINIIVNFTLGSLCIIASLFLNININNFFEWLFLALPMSLAVIVIFVIINYLLDRNSTDMAIKYIGNIFKEKLHRKNRT